MSGGYGMRAMEDHFNSDCDSYTCRFCERESYLCETCDGQGEVQGPVHVEVCPDCQGTGRAD